MIPLFVFGRYLAPKSRSVLAFDAPDVKIRESDSSFHFDAHISENNFFDAPMPLDAPEYVFVVVCVVMPFDRRGKRKFVFGRIALGNPPSPRNVIGAAERMDDDDALAA